MRLSMVGPGAALVAVLFLAAAACGGSGSAGPLSTDAATESSTPASNGAEVAEAGASDATTTADDAACPASYAAAQGTCQAPSFSSGDQACVYPEGTCRCVPAHCGGVVVPIEDDAATSLAWRCARPRADGCPERNPSGEPCTVAKQTCSYPNGCCTELATCTDGRWVTRPGACPL